MQRYITVDDALNAMCDNCDSVQAVCPHYPCKRYTAVDKIPTADVVEMTLENAIDYLHKVGWMQEHDRVLTESAQPDVPERNVGKWIEYNYPGAECVYCSKCKEEYYPDDLLLGGNDYPNFCPNCGADMRERSEDAEDS